MKLRILITSIGGHYSHDLIRAVRKEHKSFILGTDLKKNNNIFFVDAFKILPNPKDEKNYLKILFEIIKKHKIKVVIPCSDAETIPISKNLKNFEKIGVKVPLSNYKIISLINNKFKLFKYLKRKNIDVGKFKKLDSINELQKKLLEFNYPSKKIVLKPRFGGGSRGIIILDERLKTFKYLLDDKSRFCGTSSLNNLKKETQKFNYKLKNYLIMPFHSNKTYDVDCIADNGKLVFCVPRLRIYENPLSPINQGCEIKHNKTIEKYSAQIVSALKINGACDFDIIIREDNKPQLLDAGCRLSGSSTASLPLGINIVSNIINLVTKKKLKKIKIKKGIKVFPQPQYHPAV